jgi:2-hydroxycyclohexanecarboxyl-CoA dehydrogenase
MTSDANDPASSGPGASLHGRVALVTGGAGGIGRATATLLHRLGAHVVVADRDIAGASEVAEELGSGADAAFVDLADESSTVELARDLGRCDVLVSNAGIAQVDRLVDSDPSTWDELYVVNQRAPMLLTRALLPSMTSRGWGRLVYVSSDGARAGSWGESVYAATKASLFGFAKSVARETAQRGVTVNVVCPGPVRTPLLDRHSSDGELLGRLERAIPMRRIGEPTEVASLLAWLAGPESSYVTGQVLSVSGGITMH